MTTDQPPLVLVKRYKFFGVYRERPRRATHIYYIRRNNHSGDTLGTIEWYAAWRQFCFFPRASTVWSDGCLADVRDAIGRANGERRDFIIKFWEAP